MATCKQCREFEKCKDDAFINGAKFNQNESAKYCTGFEPITKADRIRDMSDEELEWVIDPAIVPPGISKREWLQQPAKVSGEENRD